MNATCDYRLSDSASRWGPPCTRPAAKLGYCPTHYQRLRREASPLLVQRRLANAVAERLDCKASDVNGVPCNRVECHRDGYCTKHHGRMLRHGDVRIARVQDVGGVRMDTVRAWMIRQSASLGVRADVLAGQYALPVDYVEKLVAGHGWREV